MFYFILLSLTVFVAYIVGRQKVDFEQEWFSIEFTMALKGVGILTVIWAHVGKQLGVPAIQFIAGVGVTLFLICFGYGMEKSFQKNGLKYFWKKRILSVYIPFAIVFVVSYMIEMYFGKVFNVSTFVGALLLVKANWYIRFLTVCYIVFFVIKGISKDKKNERIECACWLFYILISFAFYSIYILDKSAPFLQARQVLSFPLAILYF